MTPIRGSGQDTKIPPAPFSGFPFCSVLERTTLDTTNHADLPFGFYVKSCSDTHLVWARRWRRASQRPGRRTSRVSRDQKPFCTAAPPIQAKWFAAVAAPSPKGADAGGRLFALAQTGGNAPCSNQVRGLTSPQDGWRGVPKVSSEEQPFVENLAVHHVPGGLGQLAGQRLHGHRTVAALALALVPRLNAWVETDGEDRCFTESPG